MRSFSLRSGLHVVAALALAAIAAQACSTQVREFGSGGAGGSGAGATVGTGASGPGGAGGGPACTAPADCAALADVCHDGACVNGACEAVAKPDGEACDDGIACTDADACSSGTCKGTKKTCDQTCGLAVCEEISGKCVVTSPNNDGAACDDADACTSGTTCLTGVCTNGAAVDCTMGDSCVSATCDPVAGCMATPITACMTGDGCCPASCDAASDADCAPIDVLVIGQGSFFYTDGLRAFLETQPQIAKADTLPNCDIATLSAYDAVVVWGNMDNCSDFAALNAYVQTGGGVVGTPWIFNNNGGFDAMPVMGFAVSSSSATPLAITVTDPADPLLGGVLFQQGDPVGMEEWDFTLKPGATSAAYWNGQPSHLAVAKWDYGAGRGVYLDFHYITSDCTLAGSYPWGQQLAYNAVLWAAKRL